jgi:hypothetical protein
MADIQQLILDPEKKDKGVWVEWELDIKLLISSTSSREFRQATTDLLKPFVHKIRTSGLDFEERIQIIKPAIAEHLLKGWKNLTENGVKLTYSVKEALRVFDLLPELPVFILGNAEEKEWFRNEFKKESAKNSKSASAGN